MDDQSRNLILATALSFLVILAWFFLFPPERRADDACDRRPRAGRRHGAGRTGARAAARRRSSPRRRSRPSSEALAQTAARADPAPRALQGSLSLAGGRIDFLELTRLHGVRSSPDSPIVTLLQARRRRRRPITRSTAGLRRAGSAADAVPGPRRPGRSRAAKTLTETTPVTLRWDNGQGLIFRRTLSVDENYMFTVDPVGREQHRRRGAAAALRHHRPARQAERPEELLHPARGRDRMSRTASCRRLKYKAIADLPVDPGRGRGAGRGGRRSRENGWIGFTDHYWMTTLVPPAGQPFTAVTKYTARDRHLPDRHAAAGAGGGARRDRRGRRPGSSPAPRSGRSCATTRTRSRSTASSTRSTGAGSSS